MNTLLTVLNVILTIPFGFGISFVNKCKRKDFFWLPAAVGLGIEGSQLIISLSLGYPYRVMDVDGLIMNAIGILVGFGLFIAFSKLCRSSESRARTGKNVFSVYLDEVTRRN